MEKFKLVLPYALAGDQPKATDLLAEGVLRGDRAQTLLGVTGSGKTVAMARVVEVVQKPTLVLCHNKTLAAQLCAEFRDFFPENAVEYFVSYFDYYQPEAYIPHTDTYIEKDSSINDEIERLRHSATQSVLTRRDTLIVASVSCIYGLGSPADYIEMSLALKLGDRMDRGSRPRRHPGVRRRRRRAGSPHRVLRGRDRGDQRRKHPDGRIRRVKGRADDLPGEALHHAGGEAQARGLGDRDRTRRTAQVLPRQRQTARGAAPRDADALRSRHATRSRLL